MEEKKGTPLVLTVISLFIIASIILLAGGVGGYASGDKGDAVLMIAAGGTSLPFLCGFYYIVKAACIYIDKNEPKEKDEDK